MPVAFFSETLIPASTQVTAAAAIATGSINHAHNRVAVLSQDNQQYEEAGEQVSGPQGGAEFGAARPRAAQPRGAAGSADGHHAAAVGSSR